MTAADVEPLPRCCARHDDWPTLAEHLVADFRDVGSADVVRELGRAKAAVELVGLDDADQLTAAELMARHQLLLLLSGRAPDIARLDPERHSRQDAAT